jgi:hypothetical protein
VQIVLFSLCRDQLNEQSSILLLEKHSQIVCWVGVDHSRITGMLVVLLQHYGNQIPSSKHIQHAPYLPSTDMKGRSREVKAALYQPLVWW